MKTPEELTEDWKAGKLDWNKFYYIKLTSGEICIDYAHGAYFIKGKPQEITMDYTTDNDVKQILAPVPDYDELQQLRKEVSFFKREVESLRYYQTVQNEDIAKLRALLKGCSAYLYDKNLNDDLQYEIDEVLK